MLSDRNDFPDAIAVLFCFLTVMGKWHCNKAKIICKETNSMIKVPSNLVLTKAQITTMYFTIKTRKMCKNDNGESVSW